MTVVGANTMQDKKGVVMGFWTVQRGTHYQPEVVSNALNNGIWASNYQKIIGNINV